MCSASETMCGLKLALAALALVMCLQQGLAEDLTPVEHTPIKLEVSSAANSEPSKADDSFPLEWFRRTGRSNESARRRPAGDKQGWGNALAPALLAASSLLPMMLTALAALAGKALMSSLLALAVAAFNLLRSQRQQAGHRSL